MLDKIWLVVEELSDGRVHEYVGATQDEDYAEQACVALREVDEKGYRYKKYAVDYADPTILRR